MLSPHTDLECWASVPVVAGPDQPCHNEATHKVGLCDQHYKEIVGTGYTVDYSEEGAALIKERFGGRTD